MNSEYGIVEIDSGANEDGRNVGEIICTSFVNHGTPLLRYRIGDLIKLSDSRCPCGRGLPVIDSIIGRMDDVIVTPRGVRVGRMDHVFKDATYLKEAKIIQESKSMIRVLVVPRQEFTEEHMSQLRLEISSRLGSEMMVDFEIVDAVPRERNGKFRSVVSMVERGQENG